MPPKLHKQHFMIKSAATFAVAPAHILVVDDEPEIARSVAEFLSTSVGYRVTAAADGREAMEILEATIADPLRVIDLILLDVRMPGISGLDVLAWIRRHPDPGLRYSRVIVLTAASGNDEKVKALSGGADDYIPKPYYPQELLARVQTILRSQQVEKQLQRQSQQLTTLNRVSQSVAAKLTSQDVAAVATEGAEAILGVEVAAIFLTGSQLDCLYCHDVYSQNFRLSKGAFPPVPVGQGIIGLAFLQQDSFCLNDPQEDRRFRPDLDGLTDETIRSIMAVPLFVRSRPVGVLVALNKRSGRFVEADENLFASLASSVSQALENAWLIKRMRSRQQELLENRNTLQAVIDGIGHPIYTIDEQWLLVAVNRTKKAELSSPSGTMAGKPCYRVFFGREAPCEHCQASAILDGEASRRWTVKWAGSDHRPQEWDVNAYPVPGSDAGSARAVIVWQDRTEERRLGNSLIQAGKLAAIGQLAAGVAHEINNPLTAINANAEMLWMTLPHDNDSRESLELISKAGERAAQVVQGLLDFARQGQYEFAPADINDSLLQALNLVAYQMTTANIELDVDLADDLPALEGSWDHLQSVWINMLMNARDALLEESGVRRIEVATRFDSAAGEIRVVIRDNGRGMSEVEQEHIFEPFYTTKATGQGTGLGLATSHQIVEQHGGQIEVISTLGTGTAFIVHLPLNHAFTPTIK